MDYSHYAITTAILFILLINLPLVCLFLISVSKQKLKSLFSKISSKQEETRKKTLHMFVKVRNIKKNILKLL
jgi:hypothetical protein